MQAQGKWWCFTESILRCRFLFWGKQGTSILSAQSHGRLIIIWRVSHPLFSALLGSSVMPTVLILHTQADQRRTLQLKDFLQEKLGSSVHVITVRDALEDNSTLEDQLFESACVVFVYTQESEKHLEEGAFDLDNHFVIFDGSIIKAFLEQDEVIERVIAVHFGWRPEQWLYDKLHKRIFHVSETLALKENPKVNQIADTIKGIIKKRK